MTDHCSLCLQTTYHFAKLLSHTRIAFFLRPSAEIKVKRGTTMELFYSYVLSNLVFK